MWIHSGLVLRTYPTVCKRGIDFGDLCQIHVFSLGQWCGFPPGFVAIDGLLCSCSASRELHRLGLRGGSAQSESKHCVMAATPHLNPAEDRLLWGWMAQKDGWGMLGLLGAFVTGWLVLRHFEPHSVSRSVPKGFSHGLLLLKDSETSLSKPQVFKMAAGNLSSTFRFPGIFHSNFQYGGRILKGSSDWLEEVQKAQWARAKIMLNHIGTINTSHQITTIIPQHPLLHTSPSWVLCAIEPPWISAIPASCGCRTPSIAMPELSFLMAEVFRFVSNGCQFGPTHCHVCGPMSGLAQCHSACFTTRTKIQENWGRRTVLTFSACWFADGVFHVFATLPYHTARHMSWLMS